MALWLRVPTRLGQLCCNCLRHHEAEARMLQLKIVQIGNAPKCAFMCRLTHNIEER